MKDKMHGRNFIIYLLLVVFVVTGSGMGLDAEQQIFSLHRSKGDSVVTPQTFTVNRDLHTFEVNRNHSAISMLKGLRSSRSETFFKNGVLFLFILAVLARFSTLVREIYFLYDRLYVHERFYIITFMHDADGRKRIS